LHEPLAGTGQLEKWDHPDGQDEVVYRFDFEADPVEISQESRKAATGQGQGTVRSTTGTVFPHGIFRLYCADGGIMKVQNVGAGIWTILPSR
jgi:hypothetical protein